jgi:hypothetical protein
MNSARTAAAIITRGMAMMQPSQGRLFFAFPRVIRPSFPNLLFQIHFSPHIFYLYQILNIKPVLHLGQSLQDQITGTGGQGTSSTHLIQRGQFFWEKSKAILIHERG